MDVKEYIKEVKYEQGDMYKCEHFNDYYNSLLTDVEIIINEVKDFADDRYTCENKKLIRNIIIKLANMCCYDLEEKVDLIKEILR